jgi:hypothetical protein
VICFSLTPLVVQYPYEQDEDGLYFSGYDNKVHEGSSYTGYSVWVGNPSSACRHNLTFLLRTQDTFRAVWGWQILFAPERIPAMVQSMLQDYKEVLFDLFLFNGLNAKHKFFREDGCPCGRISLVRRIYDDLRSPLDTGTQRQTLWLAHTPTR